MNEIDLIILDKGTIHRIECKSGMTYKLSDVKAFKQLAQTNYQLGTSAIICNTPSVYSLGDDVYVLPIAGI